MQQLLNTLLSKNVILFLIYSNLVYNYPDFMPVFTMLFIIYEFIRSDNCMDNLTNENSFGNDLFVDTEDGTILYFNKDSEIIKSNDINLELD